MVTTMPVNNRMLIYVTGDSFSDGTGLGDHILPNYPGDIPAEEFESSKIETRTAWQEYVYKSGRFDEVRAVGRQLAWPSIVAGKLNCSVINGSYPGSTLKSIFVRMISDFAQHKPTDVIISLPNMFRIPIVLKKEPTVETQFLSITPISSELYSKQQQDLANAYWQEYDDETCLIFYLTELIAIESFVKLQTGKDPLLVNTIFFDKILDVYNKSTLPIVKTLWQQTSLSKSITIKVDSDDTYTADGHFGQSIHNKFAEQVIAII